MNQDGGVIGFRKKPKTQKKCVGNHCAVQLKKFSNFCFKNFVDHCTVRFIGSGTYGKAFLLTITDPILSPYVDIEGNPVKVIKPLCSSRPGFYFIKVRSDMSLPILPYRCEKTGKLLFPNGIFEGIY